VSDFDGDGRTNITAFRSSTATFFTLDNITNSIIANRFGSGSNADTFFNSMANDFDGDGRGDLLILSLPGATATNAPVFWSILQTATNTIRTIQWGNFATANAEWFVPGDYDGDGKTDIAVWRGATGIFYIIESSTGNPRYERWGTTGDNPSVGDYDGDGKTDLCVVRVENGQRIWYIQNSSNGQSRRIPFGLANDQFSPFSPIDVDGDGKQDISVNRIVNVDGQRVFFVLRSSDNQVFVLPWGLSTDTSLFGDYEGDGKTDFVARRNVSGQLVWYIYQSSTQTGRAVTFGEADDR
jgi:hypothetical protein